MMDYGICSYTVVQFCGYLLQLLPLLFLFYVPYSQELLRFPKRRILLCLSVFYVIMSALSAVFLSVQVWQGADVTAVRWAANILFLADIVVGTVVYFNSFRVKAGGTVFFYTVVLEYGIILYILNEIWTRFVPAVSESFAPYDITTLLAYAVCTAVTYPAIYRSLIRFKARNLWEISRRNLRMITICAIIIVLLTMVALQMEIGLRGLHSSMTEKIYESILLGCILLANVISYVIYFFCMVLEQERERMASKASAYEMQYASVREGMDRERRMHHNLRHHFRTLGVLAADGQNEELQEYIRGYIKELDDFELRKVSGNPVIDSVLSYYIQQAEEAEINVTCDIQVRGDYLFDIKDMTVLIGNAMENALKASAGCAEGAGYIRFVMKQYRQSILIKIENRVCPGNIVGNPKKKRTERSYGLDSIELIAEKYEGSMEAWQEGDVFILRVVLNMPDGREKGGDKG